jgi:hypothetical protein
MTSKVYSSPLPPSRSLMNALKISTEVPRLLVIRYSCTVLAVGVGVALLDEDGWLVVLVELSTCVVDDICVDDPILVLLCIDDIPSLC